MVLSLMSFARSLGIAMIVLLVAACTTTTGPPAPHPSLPPRQVPSAPPPTYPAPPPPASHPPPAPAPTPAPSTPVVPAPHADPSVTVALREQSVAAEMNGDHDRAVALIERALRIEPNNPQLWIDLAHLHLDEGDKAGAEQFARKALLFTKSRPDLEQQAYAVISDAQRAQ